MDLEYENRVLAYSLIVPMTHKMAAVNPNQFQEN